MKRWVIGSLVIVAVAAGVLGCSVRSRHEAKEGEESQKVTLSDLPAPARATIEKLTAGGMIRALDKEEKGGTAVYGVEATVQGKDVEYDVDSAGNVLTSEEGVPYASLPAAVRAAAETHFGTSEGLKASRELEGDKTFYEVTGPKGELRMTDTGQIAEEGAED
jgi:uncharacterized membrane protein YkoI